MRARVREVVATKTLVVRILEKAGEVLVGVCTVLRKLVF